MKTHIRIIIVAALAVAVVAAVALKEGKSGPKDAATASGAGGGVPRLVDLGADKCIPCKMMAPVLEDLKKEYAGKLAVEFIDVWKMPEVGKAYGVEVIPTQIFFNAEGKEMFRHVGFFGKEDILGKWKELGVDLSGGK